MGITRDEVKKKRLAAMGVVGTQLQANADMYDRVTEAGSEVAKARADAEAAHMSALTAEIADLNEMRDEMSEFGQAAPTTGATTGATPSASSVKPAPASNGSAALAALQAAVPNPSATAWENPHVPKAT